MLGGSAESSTASATLGGSGEHDAVIVLGILSWVLVAVLLALLLGRVNQVSRTRTSVVELPPAPPPAETIVGPTVEAARFPAEPARFVGRVEVIAAASAALAPVSGRTAVLFHGMVGAGKTTCAIELAYRRQRGFGAMAFWSAPTDPDQVSDALRQLVLALESKLAGLPIVEEIATQERLENFRTTLTNVFADAGLLLILDNLDILLTLDGQWRDPRWVPLIGALTGHTGSSRVILTSRIVPAGLNTDTVLISSVHPLSRDEALRLVRRLPNLRAFLHTEALGRRVLTLTQGHPKLLEFADGAATDPARLSFQLAEIEATVDGAALDMFLAEGDTGLDAEQLRRIFTAWTITVAATVPTSARLLLQVLCRFEETDRNSATVGANWAALWRRLDQPGEPPPLASLVAALETVALVTTQPIDDPTDPKEHMRYRIHPGVVEAIQTVTPEPVNIEVDTQLAAWWSAVVDYWAIEPPPTGQDTTPATVRASLAAGRYLLRQHDWDAASCLLERALIRVGYSPAISLAVTPLLRRVVEATGALKDLIVLGAALRKVDPGEAETLLRRAYDQAATHGEHRCASTTAGELITLLRDQGRLREALTLADQKIEHTDKAGFGSWTQLSDQGRRLQILHLLGHHEQVLIDLPGLRARMADLPDQRAGNDRVNPWNAREGVLDIGRLSAVALERWEDALDLNEEIANARRRRGASPQQIASARYNDYVPLRHLGRLADVDHLLRHCQDVFDAAGDMTQLAVIYGARAHMDNDLGYPVNAVDLQRTSLRLRYVHPDPREIATAHDNLANYLAGAAADLTEQRAHRLTAALLNHLTGNTSELTRILNALVSELRSDSSAAGEPACPATLIELTRLVDTAEGIRLGDLVIALCSEPATADDALAYLVTTAASSAQQPPW